MVSKQLSNEHCITRVRPTYPRIINSAWILTNSLVRTQNELLLSLGQCPVAPTAWACFPAGTAVQRWSTKFARPPVCTTVYNTSSWLDAARRRAHRGRRHCRRRCPTALTNNVKDARGCQGT